MFTLPRVSCTFTHAFARRPIVTPPPRSLDQFQSYYCRSLFSSPPAPHPPRTLTSLLLSLLNRNQPKQMGVSTGWGGGSRLVGIAGRRAALRLLAWGAPVTADEGIALGLLDAVAAKEGGALAEARAFLGGVLKHDARGQLLLCLCLVCVEA